MPDDVQGKEPIPSTPRPPRGLRTLGIILVLILLLWLALQQIVARLLLPPLHENAAKPIAETVFSHPHDDTTALTARLGALEAKVKTLEEAAAAARYDARIEALQNQINALQQHADVASDARLQALSARMDALEAHSNHQLAALAAFEPMKADIARGAPFNACLDQLMQLTQGDSKVQELLRQLAPYAAGGTVTTAQLHGDFEMLVPRALAEDEGSPLVRNLQSLIRIRRVGEQQQGNDDESIIARSEAKLNRGDIEASAKTLNALSPQAAKVFAPWIARTREWLQLRDTLLALQLALLAPTPAPPPPAASAPAAAATPSPPPGMPTPAPATPPTPPPADAAPAPRPDPSSVNSL